jgi:hypothetical protein
MTDAKHSNVKEIIEPNISMSFKFINKIKKNKFLSLLYLKICMPILLLFL